MGYAKDFAFQKYGLNTIHKTYIYDDSKENFRNIYVEFDTNGGITFGEVFDGLYHVMISFKKDDVAFIKKCIFEFDEKEFDIFDVK